PRLPRRPPVGQQVTPLPGDQGVHDVTESVDREEPHECEVIRHADRQTLLEIQGAVETVGEEVEQRGVADANCVFVVGPIDQKSAPNHDGQERDVEPVHPADGPWVFRRQTVHDSSLAAAISTRRVGARRGRAVSLAPSCPLPFCRHSSCPRSSCRCPSCRCPSCRCPSCRCPSCRCPSCRRPSCPCRLSMTNRNLRWPRPG